MMISDSCALRTEIRSAARGGDWELRLCMYDYDITEKKAVGERPELALPAQLITSLRDCSTFVMSALRTEK